MRKLEVQHSEISVGSHDEFMKDLFALPKTSPNSYVCFANVHMIVEAYKDEAFREVLNSAAIAAPDGRPLSIFVAKFYGMKQPRICGMDYMPKIMAEAEKLGKSVFFYGCTQDVLTSVVKKAKVEFPNLRVAGAHAPPFRKLTGEEDEEVVDMINSSGADFVFVALGCPKQEKWMYDHREKIQACMLGVGQAFLVYAGLEKRLPEWMRNLSLEWAYRLYQDPKRLWKRYVTTNSIFLTLVLGDFLHKWSDQVAVKLGFKVSKSVDKHGALKI